MLIFSRSKRVAWQSANRPRVVDHKAAWVLNGFEALTQSITTNHYSIQPGIIGFLGFLTQGLGPRAIFALPPRMFPDQ